MEVLEKYKLELKNRKTDKEKFAEEKEKLLRSLATVEEEIAQKDLIRQNLEQKIGELHDNIEKTQNELAQIKSKYDHIEDEREDNERCVRRMSLLNTQNDDHRAKKIEDFEKRRQETEEFISELEERIQKKEEALFTAEERHRGTHQRLLSLESELSQKKMEYHNRSEMTAFKGKLHQNQDKKIERMTQFIDDTDTRGSDFEKTQLELEEKIATLEAKLNDARESNDQQSTQLEGFMAQLKLIESE